MSVKANTFLLHMKVNSWHMIYIDIYWILKAIWKVRRNMLEGFFFLTFVGYSVCGFHEWSRTISWQLVVNVAKSLTRSGLGLKRLMIANSSWQGKKQGKVVGQQAHCSDCKELRIKQEVGPVWKTSRPAPKDLVHPAVLCILMLP